MSINTAQGFYEVYKSQKKVQQEVIYLITYVTHSKENYNLSD